MLFSLYHCYNYNESYVILTIAMLKLQLTVYYVFQLHYCNNYNKNYVVLTSDLLKSQSLICYFKYIAVVIATKTMYF